MSSSRSRVFVVQQPERRDGTGHIVPAIDLSSAAQWGDLVHLVSPTARPFGDLDRGENSPSGGVMKNIGDRLADFCDDDLLLLVGSPVFIGIAVAIAAQSNNGRVRLLQWTRYRYVELKINLFDCVAREYNEMMRTPY